VAPPEPLSPEIFAIKVVFGVEAELVSMNIRDRNRHVAFGRALPDQFQVGEEDVSAALLHDANAGMPLVCPRAEMQDGPP
jgi:hypothetical protein